MSAKACYFSWALALLLGLPALGEEPSYEARSVRNEKDELVFAKIGPLQLPMHDLHIGRFTWAGTIAEGAFKLTAKLSAVQAGDLKKPCPAPVLAEIRGKSITAQGKVTEGTRMELELPGFEADWDEEKVEDGKVVAPAKLTKFEQAGITRRYLVLKETIALTLVLADGKMFLHWKEKDQGEFPVNAYRKVEGTKVFAPVGLTPAGRNWACDGSIQPDTKYVYIVTRLKNGIEMTCSLEASKPEKPVDLDVDSSNTAGTGAPARTDAEEKIEDDETKPGKVIPVNDGVLGADNIPDYARPILPDKHFAQMVLELPPWLTIEETMVRIDYAASDPAIPKAQNQYEPPPDGHLRIWTKDACEQRNAPSVAAGGQYVPSGTIKASQLGFSDAKRVVTFYLEGVRPSPASGGDRIAVDCHAEGEEGNAATQDAVRLTVLRAELLAELDGKDPINNKDRAIKLSEGAVVACNFNDDNKNGVLDVNDGQVKVEATAGSRDEQDLKRVLLKLEPVPSSGTVVLRRTSGKFRVFSDPRKGVAADNDQKVLYGAPGALGGGEGDGKKTWDLAVAADNTAVTALAASGLFVEGVEASTAKRDGELSLAYTPAGAGSELLKDAMKISVLELSMQVVTDINDIGGTLAPADPLNKVFNPACIVIEPVNAPADRPAVYKVTAKPALGEDDEFIRWDLQDGDGSVDYYRPARVSDKTGTMARFVGLRPGRVAIQVFPRGAEHPYITVHPLVVQETTLEYRCNFLVDTGGATCSITPARVADIMAILNRIMRQSGIKYVPDTRLAADVIPNGTIPAAILAADVGVTVPGASQLFCRYARLKITGGGQEASVRVRAVDPVTNRVSFDAAVGRPFAAGATIVWDLTISDPAPAADGCRVISRLDNRFVDTVATSDPFASILNCRDGIVNLNFVRTRAGSPTATAAQLISPANIYSDPVTDVRYVGIDENGESYSMGIFHAPYLLAPFGPRKFINALVCDRADSPTSFFVAATFGHECLHGMSLRHRGTAGGGPDQVLMDAKLPFLLPVAGNGSAPGNVMWFTANHLKLDVDVLQSVVARGVALTAPNAGNLAIAPEAASIDLGKGLTRSDFRFTVTRAGAAVGNATVEYHLFGDGSIQLTSPAVVSTDATGVAKVSLKGTGTGGTHARLLGVTRSGADNASAAVTVNLVEVRNVVLTPSERPADGAATSSATATVLPAGRPLTWSIEGAALGCTIIPATGVVTAGVTGGTITVRATDAPTGAFAENRLTLAKVLNLALTPTSLKADGVSSLTSATADSVPAGRALTWSIQGAALGCTINAATGIVTAGNIGGTVTVRATDAPSGAFMQTTLNLVQVHDLTAAPEALKADGATLAACSAQVTPPHRPLTWSIQGDALGCRIDPASGALTAGNTGGSVVVRATDAPTGAFAEMSLPIVTVRDVVLTPAAIPSGATGKAAAAATCVPAGRALTWSISGAALGAAVDPHSGAITAGADGGTVTVRATDAPTGAFAEGSLVISRVSNIVFNPTSVPADGASTSSASATVVPAGRAIGFSIQGEALGCSIDAATGAVTVGKQPGSIRIRAADAGTGSFVEGQLTLTKP